MLCQTKGVSICPHTFGCPCMFRCHCMFGCTPCMFGCPHMFGCPPVCLCAPYVWTPPVSLDALHMFGCPLYVWMPQNVWGHPNIWSGKVWTAQPLWMILFHIYACLIIIYTDKLRFMFEAFAHPQQVFNFKVLYFKSFK